jgi:hypothetical protein
MSSTYTLYNAQQGHKALSDLWAVVKPYLIAGHRMQVTLRKEKRSIPQNAKMWAALTDIANQVDWYGDKLTAEDWKTMLTASLRKQRAVPGIEGGFVVLGLSTSKMTKEEMSELLELAIAFGIEHGVKFND